MASRKSADLERDSEALLRRGSVLAAELVAAIHTVNPTGLDLPPAIELRRYALKSKLQSRLILDFFTELDFESVTNQPGVIGLRYRPLERDACHAVVRARGYFSRARPSGPG